MECYYLFMFQKYMKICRDVDDCVFHNSVICFLLHALIYLILNMQVKNLPLTKPNSGKDVRHFEFEFVSLVSDPLSLTLLYL